LISIVSTDHAPHTDEEKSRHLEEASAGSPGVQTLYLSCLQIASDLGDVGLAPRWGSSAPAAFAGLENSKGAIAPGFDADIVVVNPNARTRVSSDNMRSRQRRGALEGRE